MSTIQPAFIVDPAREHDVTVSRGDDAVLGRSSPKLVVVGSAPGDDQDLGGSSPTSLSSALVSATQPLFDLVHRGADAVYRGADAVFRTIYGDAVAAPDASRDGSIEMRSITSRGSGGNSAHPPFWRNVFGVPIDRPPTATNGSSISDDVRTISSMRCGSAGENAEGGESRLVTSESTVPDDNPVDPPELAFESPLSSCAATFSVAEKRLVLMALLAQLVEDSRHQPSPASSTASAVTMDSVLVSTAHGCYTTRIDPQRSNQPGTYSPMMSRSSRYAMDFASVAQEVFMNELPDDWRQALSLDSNPEERTVTQIWNRLAPPRGSRRSCVLPGLKLLIAGAAVMAFFGIVVGVLLMSKVVHVN